MADWVEAMVTTVPDSTHQRYMTKDLSHILIPNYSHQNFWNFAHVIGYSRFCHGVDNVQKHYQLPAVAKDDMEALWYRGLLERYFVWDPTTMKKTTEDKQECLANAIKQRHTIWAKGYWERKQEAFPQLNVDDVPDYDVYDSPGMATMFDIVRREDTSHPEYEIALQVTVGVDEEDWYRKRAEMGLDQGPVDRQLPPTGAGPRIRGHLTALPGQNAQDRRRARRAAEREKAQMEMEMEMEFDELALSNEGTRPMEERGDVDVDEDDGGEMDMDLD